MSTTVTAKLNDPANQHALNDGAVMFFVNLGRQVYNRKTKEKEWVNYSAGLYAKDGQVQFYTDNLIKGAIVSISCPDVLPEMPDNPAHKPRLQMIDAKLEFVYSLATAAPAQVMQQVQQPMQRAQTQQMQQAQQPMRQAPTMAQQQQPMRQAATTNMAPMHESQMATHGIAPIQTPMQQQETAEVQNPPVQGFDSFDDDIPF